MLLSLSLVLFAVSVCALDSMFDDIKMKIDTNWTCRQTGDIVESKYPDLPSKEFFENSTDEYERWCSLSNRFVDAQCQVTYRKVPDNGLMTFYLTPFNNSGDRDRVIIQLGISVHNLFSVREHYSYTEQDLENDSRWLESKDEYKALYQDLLLAGTFNCYIENYPNETAANVPASDYCHVGNQSHKCCYYMETPGEDCSGCQVQNRKLRCFASCHTAMVVQIELIPKTNTDGKAKLSVVSFVQTLKQMSGPAVSQDAKTLNTFGYDFKKETHKVIYYEMQVGVMGVANALEAGIKKGFWMSWHDRKNDAGPTIKMGNEGDKEPFINHDLSTGLDNLSLQRGWNYGWNGEEVTAPKLSKIFKPRYFGIISVEGGRPIKYEMECGNDTKDSELPCTPKKYLPLPGPAEYTEPKPAKFPILVALALALIVLIGLASLVGCFYCKRNMDAA